MYILSAQFYLLLSVHSVSVFCRGLISSLNSTGWKSFNQRTSLIVRGCREWTGNQGCKIRLTTSGSSSQDGSATGAARPDTAHVTSPFYRGRLPSVALLASFTKKAGFLHRSQPKVDNFFENSV